MNNDRLHLTFTTPLDDLAHGLLSPHIRLVTAKNDGHQTLRGLMPTTIDWVLTDD